jgi:hypothetical protein
MAPHIGHVSNFCALKRCPFEPHKSFNRCNLCMHSSTSSMAGTQSGHVSNWPREMRITYGCTLDRAGCPDRLPLREIQNEIFLCFLSRWPASVADARSALRNSPQEVPSY